LLGAKKAVFAILYMQREIMNIMMSTITINTVNVQNVSFGHKLICKVCISVSSFAKISFTICYCWVFEDANNLVRRGLLSSSLFDPEL
jgi:hypothetical protein